MPPHQNQRSMNSASRTTTPTSVATTVPSRMSRSRTCDISCPMTPSSSTRFIMSSRPCVTAIDECSGSRPVANAFGACSGTMYTAGFGQPGRERQALHDVVQAWLLFMRDRPGARRGQDDAVAVPVGRPRHPERDDERDRQAADGGLGAAGADDQAEDVPDGADEDDRAEDQQNGLALVGGDLLAQGTRTGPRRGRVPVRRSRRTPAAGTCPPARSRWRETTGSSCSATRPRRCRTAGRRRSSTRCR